MRRLVLVVSGLLSLQVAARADEPKQRVEQEAERVWDAFSEGLALEPDAGREARRVLEDFVATLPEVERREAWLATDPADVLLAKAAWAAGDPADARRRAE